MSGGTAATLFASEVAELDDLIKRIEDGRYVMPDGDRVLPCCECCDDCPANFELFDEDRDLILAALRAYSAVSP